MGRPRKSEAFALERPKTGVVCIKFRGQADTETECIEIAHGIHSTLYWHGIKGKEPHYKEWEALFWEILSDIEHQVGQGIIQGAYVLPEVYYKLSNTPYEIEIWEENLKRVSGRVTKEDYKGRRRTKSTSESKTQE